MKTKHINLLGSCFFIIFLALFSFAALQQNEMPNAIYYLFFLIVSLICIASFKLYKDVTEEVHDLKNHIHIMLGVIIGGVLTFVLNVEFKLGAAMAAGLVGILGAYLPQFIRLPKAKDYAVPVYCGAFVGMSSTLVLSNIWLVLLASSLAALLFVVVKNVYLGVGGRLGVVAFMGVTLSTAIWTFFGGIIK
jgi:hypothetical protein